MKKYVLIIVCILLVGFCTDISAFSVKDEQSNSGKQISVRIETPSFEIVNNEIILENYGRLSTIGAPILPSRILSIAIPPKATFLGFNYECNEIQNLPGEYSIPALTPPNIEGSVKTEIETEYQEIYNENYNRIYTSDDIFPLDAIEFVGTAGYREYNLVEFRISPFYYKALLKELSYYPSININVEYEESKTLKTSIMKKNGFIDEFAQKYIINYDQTDEWYQEPISNNEDSYDFVVITLDSLLSSITSLVDWEEIKGKTVKVVTLSWIEDNYQGYDQEEKIRNFLRDKYPSESWGIEDVLIVGHWDDIPMRRTAQKIATNYNEAETDYYYAELSLPDIDSWDTDGDHIYGENADPIDFYAEVNVGRFPWSEPETVEHICEKSVSYEQNSDLSYKNNILLLASIVDPNTDGAVYMEYKVNEEIHPWMGSWTKTRMYESESEYAKDYTLNNFNVVSVWSNSKFGFVSWHAHGSPTGSYANNRAFISVDDCPSLNDEYPAIISSASCSNSDTDYLNIGQAMIKQGAVGFLGANKAAFYRSRWDDPNDGSDQSMKYFFTAKITSGEYTQGQAHQYALHEMYSRGLWDRTYYDTFCHGSLWGNPDLGMATVVVSDPPEKPQTPEGPTSGIINEDASFSTSTTDPNGDQIYFKFDWDDGSFSEWEGPYISGEEISVTHSWNTRGNYEIKVKAKDEYGAESQWSDPLPITMPRLKVRNFDLFEQFIQGKINLPRVLIIFMNILEEVK